MQRVNAILQHPLFIESLRRTDEHERDRVFCGHGMDHLIDVARLAYILSLESGAKTNKELIYAAALLHDIGRARQYEDGTPHEIESARIAEKILPECGFYEFEIDQILDAILSHRTNKGEKPGFPEFIIERRESRGRACSAMTEQVKISKGLKPRGLCRANARQRGVRGSAPGLTLFIYRADKLSRRCFECAAISDCDWDIKNMRLEY